MNLRNTSNPSDAYLELHKLEDAQGMYDDGIFYYFNDSSPQHVSFQLYTDSGDVESCDVRLTTDNITLPGLNKEPWQDVAFFRFGYFNYMKLNLMSMV